MYERFAIGLRAGALFGLTLGACFEFIHPGLGKLASAAYAVMFAPIAGLIFTLLPKLASAWQKTYLFKMS